MRDNIVSLILYDFDFEDPTLELKLDSHRNE